MNDKVPNPPLAKIVAEPSQVLAHFASTERSNTVLILVG